ncbi:MAG: hypothetical protein GXY01_08105 [Clostridiales bacterium]|nr:hypothetical protein [Clostridiales bacterium]
MFCDFFIHKDIDDNEFKVSQLVLRLLNKYPLGIGAWLIACRIKAMIKAGVLQIFQKNPNFIIAFLKKIDQYQ